MLSLFPEIENIIANILKVQFGARFKLLEARYTITIRIYRQTDNNTWCSDSIENLCKQRDRAIFSEQPVLYPLQNYKTGSPMIDAQRAY